MVTGRLLASLFDRPNSLSVSELSVHEGISRQFQAVDLFSGLSERRLRPNAGRLEPI